MRGLAGAFAALRELLSEGELRTAVCVGVRSDETPEALEEQADVLQRYAAAGIEVGKIQVSSALQMHLDLWEPPADEARAAAIAQLKAFAEDRYLHQTVVRRDGQDLFYEDLPLALAAEDNIRRGEWRVHFHIPIYVQQWGRLQATQSQILDGLRAASQYTTCQHYEVETYAWGVLPAAMQQPDLAAGITQELRWLDAQWEAAGLLHFSPSSSPPPD